MKCLNHNDKDAIYKCVNCGNFFCNECVKSFHISGLTTNFCPKCNSQCKDIKSLSESELENSSENKSEEVQDDTSVKENNGLSEELQNNDTEPELSVESSDKIASDISGQKEDIVNSSDEDNKLNSSTEKIEAESISSSKTEVTELSDTRDKIKLVDIQKSTSKMLKQQDAVSVSHNKTERLFKPVKTIIGVDGSITKQSEKKDNSVTEVVERLQKELATITSTNLEKEEETIDLSQKISEDLPSEIHEEHLQDMEIEHKSNLAIPNSISVFFKIIFSPARAFKDSILDFNTSRKFRISFFIATSLFLFFSVYLKSFHDSVLVVSLEIVFLNIIFALLFTGFLSRIGKVSYLFDFTSFVFGISIFIYLLQIISISYFDPRFQGAIISGISVFFLLLRAFIFVLGVNSAFEVPLIRLGLFFMIAFSFGNLLVFMVSHVLLGM